MAGSSRRRGEIGRSESRSDRGRDCGRACGIAQLHAEGVRFGEIAVLERSNTQLNELAAALDNLRVPYLLESPGLFSTREGGLLLAGLRLAADRSDSLAAATALHLVEDPHLTTPLWLSDRLRAVSETTVDPETGERINRAPWDGHELFRPLEAIDFRGLAPSLVVQQVIEAFGLPKRVHAWGDSARRCANLDSAIRHAREYEESALAAGRSATLSGLILYFEGLANEGGDVRIATPGHDAVTLLTYHSAKGLEWPVVVLAISGGRTTASDSRRGRGELERCQNDQAFKGARRHWQIGWNDLRERPGDGGASRSWRQD